MFEEQIIGKENEKAERFLVLSILVLITGILFVNINKLNGITIIGDEYGYWAAGAFFAGMDWNDVNVLNPYYAYGYGFILCLLLKIVPDMILAYKIAILLNIGFICGGFLLMIQVAKILFPKVSGKILILASGCITLYSNTLFQSQTTQVEAILYFLFCLLAYVFLLYVTRKKIGYGMLTCLISIYMFTIHMRCVSIVAALAGSFLLLLWKKETKMRHVGLFLIVLCTLFGTSMYMKKIVKENAYTKTTTENQVTAEETTNKREDTIKSANDFSGQSEKIKSLFTVRGLRDFLISFIGKFYYLCASSFLFFLWAIGYLLKQSILLWKREEREKENGIKAYFSVFLLLAFALTMAVSALFMVDITRQDTLVYGRYNEYICGPFLLIGLIEFLSGEKKLKKHNVVLGVFLCLSVIVYAVINITQVEILYDNNVVGIVYWIIKIFGDVGKENFVFAVAVEVILFYSFLVLLQYIVKNKKYQYMIMIGLCSLVWIVLANEVFSHNTKRQQLKVQTDYNLLEVTNASREIYLATSFVSYTYVDYLQFFSGDNRIKVIDTGEVADLKNGAYVFAYKDVAWSMKNEDLKYIGKSEHFILYQKEK